MGRKGFRGALAVAALAMAMPAVAEAGTAFVSGSPGARLIGYAAAPGEQGRIVVEQVATPQPVIRFVEESDNPVVAGAGCVVPDAAVRAVECPWAPGDGVGVGAGDGNDIVAGVTTLPMFVNAGPGDDVIGMRGFTAATDVSGGTGRDLVTYESNATAVSVTLDGLANDGGPGELDQIDSDVEVLEGGDLGDVLIGDDGSQELRGGHGTDRLEGRGGPDVLKPGAVCEDVLDGGAGDDVLHAYASDCGEGIDVHGGPGRDLLDLTVTPQSSPLFASLDDVDDDGLLLSEGRDNYHSDIEDVRGGAYDDVLLGNAADNVIEGGLGDDVLDGSGGSDDLRGGEGEDVADYSTHSAALGLSLDGVRNDGAAGENDLIGTDVEHLVGGTGNDELLGGPGDNGLDGGPGADVLRGGGGVDSADYALRTAHVFVDLGSEAADDGESGEHDSVASDVEGVIGGQGGNRLTGDTRDGFLIGGGGRDTLTDPGGRDVLLGGERPDRIVARDGAVDDIGCGTEADHVEADPGDQVQTDCETVNRAAPSVPAPQQPAPRQPVRDRTPTRVPRPIQPPAPDTRAPRAALFARTGNRLVTTMRRTSLRIRVGCDEPCRATAKLTAHAQTARSLARRGFKRGTLVARGTSRLGTLSALTLRPTKRGKKMLRAFRRGRYRLTVVVTDAAGNRTTVRRTVTVRR